GLTDCGPGVRIVAESYETALPRRWVLDELRVRSPLGDGSDLLDKLKYRVYDLYAPFGGIATSESEESWAVVSLYTGQKSGPVRVIRQVNDAASAYEETFVRTYAYPRMLVREHNLRVHALNYLWQYFDYASVPVTYHALVGGSVTTHQLDGSP
ncbi:MAG: hypothetical protein HC945_01295, partial [Nitrosarchaeum sp.]|nr:hypothetical protein [Nitrosarchaeum sp.]